MLVIRYTGGLGNQMFQYAFQLRMQRAYPDKKIYADLSHYKLTAEHNGFELGHVFKIMLDSISDQTARRMSPYYVPSSLIMKMPQWFRKRMAVNYQHKIKRIKEKLYAGCLQSYYKSAYHSAYEEQTLHLDAAEDWYLDGLWQHIDYILPCQSEIVRAFDFQNEDKFSDRDKQLIEKAKWENVVSIHIRRGDFVNSKFDICGVDYYRQAMKLMEDNVSKIFYYFFTDDIRFVEKEFAHISPKEVICHSLENSVLDMEMMSRCRYNIISNSTFSYWAAFLNQRKGKVVMAPQYSIIKQDKAYELSAPEEWIKISNGRK